MKKFSLKKITAAVSAAAMIATMGTSAFAAEGNAGVGVSIDTITKTVVDADKQIYNIKVDFTSSSANEIGMTMLTYGAKDDSSLTLNTDWADNAYSDDTMKIIGVDQISPVTSGNTGSFEFKITTDKDAGAIYLKKGATALIALSGDGVTTPAVAPLSINAIAGYAAPVALGAVSMDANADVSAALTDAAKAAKATIYEKQSDTDNLGEVSLADATIGAWTESEGTYTATATLPSSTVMSGVDFPAAGLTVNLSATVKFTAVDANTATAVEGFTATASEFTKTVTADDTTTNDKIKENVLGKKVTLADATGKVSGTVDITAAMVSTSDTYDPSNEADQVITYTVTVPEGITSNELLNVPTGGIPVTVKVTVTKTPVIKAIALDGAKIEVTVTKGDDDDATKAAIKKAIADKVTKANGYKFVVDGTDVELANATYEWTVTGSDKAFTATLKVTAVTGEGLAEMPATGIDATLPEIVITVNDKPAVVYGDVDGNGKIEVADAMAIMRIVNKFMTATQLQLQAADVTAPYNTDGYTSAKGIEVADAMSIMQYVNKFIDKFPVEK